MKKLFVISVILMGIGIFGFIFGSMIQTNGIELPVIANIGIHLFLIGGIFAIIGTVWCLLSLLNSY